MEKSKFGKVSVIIPTWNRESTIGRSILSVLKQTYTDLEIIVVDDGSVDDTKKVVSSFVDKRIEYVCVNHSGFPSVVRNIGVSLAKGTWVSFLDSDDYWEEDKLEKQLNVGVDFVCTNASMVHGKHCFGKYIKNVSTGKKTFSKLLSDNFVVTSSVLVRRSILDDVGCFPKELKTSEDYALWLKVATRTPPYYLDECLVGYSYSSEDSVRKNESDKRLDAFCYFKSWAREKSLFIFIVHALYIKKYYFVNRLFSLWNNRF